MEIIERYDDGALTAFLEQWHDATAHVTAHTSGSTGTPKEIRLPKADMIASSRATCSFFGINASSTLMLPLSVNYIAGKMMVVRALVGDCRLIVVRPSRDLSAVADVDGDIDLLPIVPTQVDALLRLPNLSHIKQVIVGGAPLSEQQEQQLKQSGVVAYATYGMTETCSHVALRRIGLDEAFTAMPGISFDTDPDGCLTIKAPGYTQGIFQTNDVVRLTDSEHFIWLGRRDNVINSGGIKIVPEQVEAILRPYLPGVNFYLTSRKSPMWGEEVVMVVDRQGTAYSAHMLDQAKRHIAHHLLPKAVIEVDTHEYTTTGKLKRRKFD